MVPFATSVHFWVWKSNRRSLLESAERAGIYLPSGDRRGEYIPCDPGNVVIWWVARSRIRMVDAGSVPVPEKTILLPSGDQFGSA